MKSFVIAALLCLSVASMGYAQNAPSRTSVSASLPALPAKTKAALTNALKNVDPNDTKAVIAAIMGVLNQSGNASFAPQIAAAALSPSAAANVIPAVVNAIVQSNPSLAPAIVGASIRALPNSLKAAVGGQIAKTVVASLSSDSAKIDVLNEAFLAADGNDALIASLTQIAKSENLDIGTDENGIPIASETTQQAQDVFTGSPGALPSTTFPTGASGSGSQEAASGSQPQPSPTPGPSPSSGSS